MSNIQEVSKVGFMTGRFHLFHNGHLKYALRSLAEVDFLIIGICNPDASAIIYDEADASRHKPLHNPFTYWERSLMVQQSLLRIGVDRSRFETTPCPINRPELVSDYIPRGCLHLAVIFDEWGRKKMQLLKEHGYPSRVVFEGSKEGERTGRLPIDGSGQEARFPIEEGKNIRQRLLEDNNWRAYVPKGTAEVIEQLDLATKLRERIALAGRNE